MPYIKREQRKKWEKPLKEVKKLTDKIDTFDIDGELNYFITSILKQTYSPKYFNYNKAMGLLECIKQEYYRRVVAPYEDLKIIENGDLMNKNE